MKKEIILISTNSAIIDPANECVGASGYTLSTIAPEKACNYLKGRSPSAIVWDRDPSCVQTIESFRSALGSYIPIILLTENGHYKIDFKTWAEDFVVVQKGNLRELSLTLKQMHSSSQG